ncbi:MAG TPA: ABC transporter permease [Methylomirabilota bacterium]|jgi:ABC-type spermidine/putrescine transport system permease subunit I|nr:ABC transporter permease [Methylomirabilota bacterium]
MRARSSWGQGLALVGPAFVLLLAVYLYPLARLLVLSLTGGDGALGFGAYRRFLESSVYVGVLLRTFRISLVVTVVCLMVAYPVSLVLSRAGSLTLRVLMVFVLLPLWTSILVRTYAWMVLLQANGVVNNLLRRLNVIDEPLRLMYNETGVVIGMAQVLLPFAILPVYASLRNIDPRLPAAARIMGAGPWRRFLSVTLPLSLPGVAAAGLLVFVQALGFFITPALLGGSRVITLAMVIETQVVDLLDWGLASAVAMVLLVVTVILVVGYDRLLGLDKVWA